MIINRIQVLNYGCLRYVDVPMGRFHLLIGPNASGKSTLMDAIKFVSDVVRDGVEAACVKRTANFQDLVWGRPEDPEQQRFEIALEFDLPEEVREKLPASRNFTTLRYEIGMGFDDSLSRVGIFTEQAILQTPEEHTGAEPSLAQTLPLFPSPTPPPNTIVQSQRQGYRRVFSKRDTGRTWYYSETSEQNAQRGWNAGVNLGANRSALSILPDDDEHYPAVTRVLTFLRDRIVDLSLNSGRLREASPPRAGSHFAADGSNLPWLADSLLKEDTVKAKSWLGHMECALSGFESVRVVDRQDDRHKYLMLKYDNGLEVPSWKASDGTLRFMALTILANLPQASGLYTVEEPENGIHPGALEELFNSLSSVYDAQVLLATHSPEFVAIADVEHLLCFAKTAEGVVDVSPGMQHPRLREWQHEVDLGTFFASGMLA
jgi:predicted ATPase